ncbi:MAG: deoxyribonuclease IV [Armatimonadota bacterium]
MRLGVHVSIGKGLRAAAEHAGELGCESIQMFSSNPNSWKVKDLDEGAAAAFREGIERLGIRPVALHTPYLLNLASSKNDIWTNSWENLAWALEKAAVIGADYTVTHIGSHGGDGFETGADRVKDGIICALDKASGNAMALLEAGSGGGNTIGWRFEELASILERLDDYQGRVGVCLDTAHLWGAGYDISTAAGVDKTLGDFDRLIGLSQLKVIHLNDTRKLLGSRADRHWHIGQGNIGTEGFKAIVNHPSFSDTAGILETPDMESGKDIENLNELKKLRL